LVRQPATWDVLTCVMPYPLVDSYSSIPLDSTLWQYYLRTPDLTM